jgi:hypothetical protein
MKFRIIFSLGFILMLFCAACGQQNTEIETPGSGTPALPAVTNCRQAELVSETIPPGTKYQAGAKFDKTWIIRNTSPCIWTYQYSLVYYDGAGMGAPSFWVVTENLPIYAVISPGDTATLTLNLRAPFAPGRQVGYWKLRDPAGVLFAPSNIDQGNLSVDIFVTGTTYSFADNLCQAEWSLDGQPLDCPLSDADGTVKLRVDNFPHLEAGGVENEPAIRIMLSNRANSTLSAVFPAMMLNKGDHLHGNTACVYNTPQCDLTFKVSYLSDTGSGVLGEWHEIFDANNQSFDLDLSNLAGRNIQFVFSVHSDAAIEGNQGYWFFPIILPY